MSDRSLPGVPRSRVEEMYNAAPGNEIQSGNFDDPESSSRLAANPLRSQYHSPLRPPYYDAGQFLRLTWPLPSQTWI